MSVIISLLPADALLMTRMCVSFPPDCEYVCPLLLTQTRIHFLDAVCRINLSQRDITEFASTRI